MSYNYFNTSHVNVNPAAGAIANPFNADFNTSHVNVNRSGCVLFPIVSSSFQYISC